MRTRFALATTIGLALSGPALAAPETICGWFDNPTPGNASLWDRSGEWTIGTQGGFQAEGDWPGPFGKTLWVAAGNGDYGYGCACVTGELDHEQNNVTKIVSSRVKPLAACRKDKALKGVEAQFK